MQSEVMFPFNVVKILYNEFRGPNECQSGTSVS
jgi:hypothetical protein